MGDKVVLFMRYRGFNPGERMGEYMWIMNNREQALQRVKIIAADDNIFVQEYKIFNLVEDES
jgi:hypothetical protein